MSQIEPYRRPVPARIDPPAKRWLQGEVLPPPQRYETIHEWGEPMPYVSHPAPPTRRGWVFGLIVGGLILAGIFALSSLPEIVGWIR